MMRAVVLLVALSALVGCQKKQLEVVTEGHGDDYGQADVTAAALEAAKTPGSPVAFRRFALRIEELRPRFNEKVALYAELELSFLSIAPMSAQLASSPDEQLAALALTVWPTAFRAEPIAGETPRQYLERICSGPLGSECKYVVPEAWAIVMNAKTWRRMKLRAREAYSSCSACQKDPSYQRVLEDYDRHDTAWQARVKTLGEAAQPGFWPRAGTHAEPWTDPPLLDLATSTVGFEGVAVEDAEWRRALVARREGRGVLGIHLRPRQEVRVLRSALADAARAGWAEVALQAREAAYPYRLVEYRIATRRRGTPLAVRDVDTIQIAIQALDAAVGRTLARAPGSPAPISL